MSGMIGCIVTDGSAGLTVLLCGSTVTASDGLPGLQGFSDVRGILMVGDSVNGLCEMGVPGLKYSVVVCSSVISGGLCDDGLTGLNGF